MKIYFYDREKLQKGLLEELSPGQAVFFLAFIDALSTPLPEPFKCGNYGCSGGSGCSNDGGFNSCRDEIIKSLGSKP